jgi:hypothetical protein
MSRFIVPLTPEPQTFGIALAGVQYRLTLRWCGQAEGGWMLDIADADDAPLACGLAVVTGADLLEQYPDLGIGGMLWIYSTTELPPGYDDLGGAMQLIFETED